MSRRELEWVEVMGRVGSGDLGRKDGAAVLGLSCGQAKRVWRGYREVGPEALKHGNAGRESNRGKPKRLRRRVPQLIRKKYSGREEERFGPTLTERNHGTHQDRLIKKLRRRGICGYAAANRYLEREYLPEHNRRLARPQRSPWIITGAKPSARELREISVCKPSGRSATAG